ncbi:unnamed protein product, partial [Clonostachys chloroleuca]
MTPQPTTSGLKKSKTAGSSRFTCPYAWKSRIQEAGLLAEGQDELQMCVQRGCQSGRPKHILRSFDLSLDRQ